MKISLIVPWLLWIGVWNESFASDLPWSDVPKPVVLDSLAKFRVDSIEFVIKDAFEDAKVVSIVDETMYSVMNKLHIQTKQSVVQKLLLFKTGDTIQAKSLIESERLLRGQKIFSDAKIEWIPPSETSSQNIIRVITSDNWTTTLPISLSKPGEELVWSIGILESNVLGLGQSIGLYYGHEEERDSWLLRYGNPHFLFPNNRLFATWSHATDGYTGQLYLGKPLLARSRNEWAYTIEGLTQKISKTKYWSDSKLPFAKSYLNDSLAALIPRVDSEGDSIAYRKYEPGVRPNPLMVWDGVFEDSLSIRIGKSFGNGFKYFLRGVYDYRNERLGEDSQVRLARYQEGDRFWRLDTSNGTLDSFLTPCKDSRIGMSFTASRIKYTRQQNFHRIKWTEDVDRGWSLFGHLSRNFKALGAGQDDWFAHGSSSLSLGSGIHSLSLGTSLETYLTDDLERRNLRGKIQGEYLLKYSLRHATVFDAQLDVWRNAPLGQQLYLGGLDGLNGLPTALLAGHARYYAGLEQRYFPDIEIGTLVPVMTGFLNAGNVFPNLEDFDPEKLQMVAGLGLRLGLSKSVEGVINHLNVSWVVKGPNVGEWRTSWIADINL